jgi:hypothetical protein
MGLEAQVRSIAFAYSQGHSCFVAITTKPRKGQRLLDTASASV